MRELTLTRNVQSSGGNSPSALMSSRSGSLTSVEGLTANSNALSILRVVEGSLEMKGATIRTTRESSLLLDHAQAAVVVNSSFIENFALLSGAGIMSNATKSLTVSHCEFISNTAENGAAIASFDGNLTIDDCSFEYNAAIRDAGSLLVSNGTLELFSSFFRNNNASGSGGAILLTASRHSRLSVECHNNVARDGGCLYVSASRDLVVHRCVFHGNRASDDGGGAAILDESSVRLDEVIWSENVARLQGGGILIKNSTITSRRSKYLENSATHGAGLRVIDGRANVDRDSFVRNKAQSEGGGVSALNTTIDLKNCLLSKNVGRNGGGLNAMYTITVIRKTTFKGNAALTERGGGFFCRSSEVTILDSLFLSNRAAGIGGGFDMTTCNVTGSNLTIRRNHADGSGGINCSGGSLFNLSNSVLRYNSASDSGGLAVQSGSLALLSTCIIESNSASNAGGIGVYINGKVVLENSTVSSNRALRYGGAVRLREGELIISTGSMINNEAALKGGCLFGEVSSVFASTNCSLRDNGADIGGCLYLDKQTQASFRDSVIENSTAAGEGGAVFLEDSEMMAQASTFRGNEATVGGSISAKNASLQLTESAFADDKGTLIGGSIAADQNTTLLILDTSLSRARASRGGSIWLSQSNLTAYGLTISECVAKKNGGGVLVNASSTFLCSRCIFIDNAAARNGGAIAFAASKPESLALQLNDCTFEDNSADLGGAITLGNKHLSISCCRCRSHFHAANSEKVQEIGCCLYLCGNNGQQLFKEQGEGIRRSSRFHE